MSKIVVKLVFIVFIIFSCNISFAIPTTFTDKASFLGAAGSTTVYGFESHNLTESTFLTSPIAASDLDNSFDLVFSGFNAFEIIDNAAAPGVIEGSHYLFTHSSVAFTEYSLTFSNFNGINDSITEFGITITDFASGLAANEISSIDYVAGVNSGNLLTVFGAQPDYTENFIGLTVSGAEAFDSITLTFDDINSGFQMFDEVIYSAQAQVPSPGTFGLMLLGALGLVFRQSKKSVSIPVGSVR